MFTYAKIQILTNILKTILPPLANIKNTADLEKIILLISEKLYYRFSALRILQRPVRQAGVTTGDGRSDSPGFSLHRNRSLNPPDFEPGHAQDTISP